MSRSLNTSIAACSSGVARPAVSSITETRYCISGHLLWFGALLVGGLSPVLRTPLPRSDTPPDLGTVGGMILVERRVHARGHDISCRLGEPGPGRVRGLER